jgi:putative membrane protein
MHHGRVVVWLTCIYAALWFVLAIEPFDRQAWVLENMLVMVLVPLLAWGYRRMPFSLISYVMLFLFLCLHAVGSHYTYSNVPYDSWLQDAFGGSLNAWAGWSRNHFDRFVHFGFGLLIVYPTRELFVRIADARGFWGYFLPLIFVMALSLVYELIEWAAAARFGGELGIHYLGTQGDEWDGHRDMGLASLGALLAMAITAIVNSVLQRDFAREWHDSLRVKGTGPLGEHTIARMLKARRQAASDDPVLKDPRL